MYKNVKPNEVVRLRTPVLGCPQTVAPLHVIPMSNSLPISFRGEIPSHCHSEERSYVGIFSKIAKENIRF